MADDDTIDQLRQSDDENTEFVTTCASPNNAERSRPASAIVELPTTLMTDITKPFSFVSGNTKKTSRLLPFKKSRSGIQKVIYKQATKGRLVHKNGSFNTISDIGDGKSYKLFKDIFITLLDLSWNWIFAIFAAGFFLSWLLFAVVWYVTFLQHGDFDEMNMANESFVPCASAITDFASCFLFSVETQHTIGYGGRATTEQCPVAILIMCLQSILGVIIQACMAGIIFAKFTVPRTRGETIIFSKNAVVTKRNGFLHLMCRVTDLRKYSLLEAHARMILINKVTTDEGEEIPLQQTDLECGTDLEAENDRLLIMWPTTLSHKIDEDSPLFKMTPSDLAKSNIEIVVVLEGVTEETGNTIQKRTSYLPPEIIWGHRFENESMVVLDKRIDTYIVNHNLVSKTRDDATPQCSAMQLKLRNSSKQSSLSE